MVRFEVESFVHLNMPHFDAEAVPTVAKLNLNLNNEATTAHRRACVTGRYERRRRRLGADSDEIGLRNSLIRLT